MLNDNHLIWIDLEMTGLDSDVDKIIEIATIITDSSLNILEEGPVFAIHQTNEILDGMDEWNTKQHAQSGLVDRVKASDVTCAHAEAHTIAFLSKFVRKGKSPMCGNTICQDRRFLYRNMPTLEAYFHYRHIDVSTIKELALRWAPEKIKGFAKESKHLALDDIKDSIAELKYYREHLMLI